MAFEHPLTARFHEADPVGVVFFARYFEYAHVAFEELMGAAFEGGDAVFEGRDFGLPLVHAAADYRRPVRRGDRLTVRTRIEAWSERSVTFAHQITGADDPADLRTTVRLKHAFVALPAFKPTPRPAAFVEAMVRLGVAPDEGE